MTSASESAFLRICPLAEPDARAVVVMARCATAMRLRPPAVLGPAAGVTILHAVQLRQVLYWLAAQTGELTAQRVADTCGVPKSDVVAGCDEVNRAVLRARRNARSSTGEAERTAELAGMADRAWLWMELARLSWAPNTHLP